MKLMVFGIVFLNMAAASNVFADVPVNLQWDSTLTREMIGLELGIFSDPEYRNPVATVITTHQGEAGWVAPQEGVYHWRVRKATVDQDLLNGSFVAVEAGSKGSRLRVSWEAIKGAEEYNVTRRSLKPIDTRSANRLGMTFLRGEIPFIIEISPQGGGKSIASLRTYNFGLRGEGFLPAEKTNPPGFVPGKSIKQIKTYEISPKLPVFYLSAGAVGIDEFITASGEGQRLGDRQLQPGSYIQSSGLVGRWVGFDFKAFYYQSFHEIELPSSGPAQSNLIIDEDRYSLKAAITLNALGSLDSKHHQLHFGPIYNYRILPQVPILEASLDDDGRTFTPQSVGLYGASLSYVYQDHRMRTALSPIFLISGADNTASYGIDLSVDWAILRHISLRTGSFYKYIETKACDIILNNEACVGKNTIKVMETAGYLGVSYQL